MFDPLAKHKRAVSEANQQYHLARQRADSQLFIAKEKSRYALSSPKGLATSFAAGSVKGATSQDKSGAIRIITLLARGLITA